LNNRLLQQASSKINQIFSEEILDKLAKESGFIQRHTGKITALGFAFVMIVSVVCHKVLSLNSLCELLQRFSGFRASSQALSLRLGSPHAVRFLRRCFIYLLSEKSGSAHSKLKVTIHIPP